MKPSKVDAREVIRQAQDRAKKIAADEKRLEAMRELRAVDAGWLVRNTTLMRSTIAQVLGVSRVTLNVYLSEAGYTDEYLASVRALQKEQGITLYSAEDLGIAPAKDE